MEILPVLPHLVTLTAGLALVLVLPFLKDPPRWSGEISLAVLVIAALPIALDFPADAAYFGGAIQVDGFAQFFVLAFHSVAALVVLASLDFTEGRKNRVEYYALILLATAGMDIIAASTELIAIFLALEITSLSTYALVAFHKDEERSIEAAIKYFLVGAFSSAVLLFGISLIYGATGTTFLSGIVGAEAPLGLVLLGTVMIIAGFGFKIAAVPFHTWAPDTYEGAPTPISGYLASASKAAGFVVLLRLFYSYPPGLPESWLAVLAAVAGITMIVGNVAALPQRNLKRLLAYSGIAHTGYVLIVVVTLNETGAAAGLAHLLVYAFINTGPFLFIALMDSAGIGERIDDLTGIYRRAPYATFSMALFMLALIGLPPTGGFFTKLFIFLSAIEAGYWWLAAIGVVMSAVSLYYYARIVKFAIVDDDRPILRRRKSLDMPRALRLSVVICGVMTFATFVLFAPLWDLALAAAQSIL